MEQPAGLTVAEWAWIAGFFDGEGCVRITLENVQKRKSRHSLLYASISNTDRRPLDWIKDQCGGYLHPVGSRLKVCWQLELGSARAERFLRAIRPYLQVKDMQVDIALKFRETFDPHYPKKLGLTSDILARREELRLAIAALKH